MMKIVYARFDFVLKSRKIPQRFLCDFVDMIINVE